jgi:hypothetical protein
VQERRVRLVLKLGVSLTPTKPQSKRREHIREENIQEEKRAHKKGNDGRDLSQQKMSGSFHRSVSKGREVCIYVEAEQQTAKNTAKKAKPLLTRFMSFLFHVTEVFLSSAWTRPKYFTFRSSYFSSHRCFLSLHIFRLSHKNIRFANLSTVL